MTTQTQIIEIDSHPKEINHDHNQFIFVHTHLHEEPNQPSSKKLPYSQIEHHQRTENDWKIDIVKKYSKFGSHQAACDIAKKTAQDLNCPTVLAFDDGQG